MTTDARLKWLSLDYAQSEPGQIAGELLEARGRIAQLEGALHCELARHGEHYCDVCQKHVRATAQTPPHLRGPIIQAFAETNGVPPQGEKP